jgi:hypothetical protein
MFRVHIWFTVALLQAQEINESTLFIYTTLIQSKNSAPGEEKASKDPPVVLE